MKVLSVMPDSIGSQCVLVEYKNNSYAYGSERYTYGFVGFPMDQCGNKNELLSRFNLMIQLCKQNIDKYNNTIKYREDPVGLKLLLEYEQKEYEMYSEFAKVLSESKTY